MGMMTGFPRIRIGFAMPFGGSGDNGDGDDFGMMPDLGGMMSSMRRRMDDMMGRMRAMMGGEENMMGSMMDSMMQRMGEGQGGDGGGGGGHGRSVSVQIQTLPKLQKESIGNDGQRGVISIF